MNGRVQERLAQLEEDLATGKRKPWQAPENPQRVYELLETQKQRDLKPEEEAELDELYSESAASMPPEEEKRNAALVTEALDEAEQIESLVP